MHPHTPEAICRALERWSGWTHQDIESDKTTVDTVNALVVVAAFIAGVQSTIITFTLNLPRTPTGESTNVVAFVGLLLDVIGTFLGVVHAIVLQRRIRANTSLLNAMTEISRSLRAIQRLMYTDQDKLTQDQLHDLGIDDPQQHLRRAQQLHDVLENRFKGRTTSGPFSIALHVLHAGVFPLLGKETVKRYIKSMFELGHTPLVAMAGGVMALVVSIIMFAAESSVLPPDVWVSCVTVLVGVLCFSLLPIMYGKAKNYFFPSGVPKGSHV